MTDNTPAPEGVTPEQVAALENAISSLRDGIACAEGDMARDLQDAEHTGERPDLSSYSVALDVDEDRIIINRIEAIAADRDAQKARADAAELRAEHAEDKLNLEQAIAQRMVRDEAKRAEAAEAKVARLVEAIDYILDGMGIDAPDYEIDPDDDFLDAANSDWVRDVLTRLAAAITEVQG